MRKDRVGARVRRVAILAAVIGLIAAAWPLTARLRVEARSRTVDLAVDGPAMAGLASLSGLTYPQLLGQLRGAGLTAAIVPETTLASLVDAGQVAAVGGDEVLARRALGRDPLPGVAVQPTSTYVIGADAALASHLAAALGPGLVRQVGTASVRGGLGDLVLAIGVPASNSFTVPLGFLPQTLQPYAAAGMHAVLSLKDAARLSPATLASWLRQAAAVVPVDGLYFSDARGPSGDLAPLVAAMHADGVPLVVQEGPVQLGNVDQGGLAGLDQALGAADTIRLFDMLPYAPHRPPDQVIQTVERAVRERNLRVIALYPVTNGVSPTAQASATVTTYRQMVDILRAGGYPSGKATPMPQLPGDPVPLAVMCAAIAVVTVAFGSEVLHDPGAEPWIAAAVFSAMLALGEPSRARTVFSLLASLAYAAWPLWTIVGAWRRRTSLVWPALEAAGWAIAGGLTIAAVTATRNYLLEWSVFHGVKVAYAVPPLIVLAAFVLHVGMDGAPQGLWQGIRTWGLRPQRAYELAALGLVAVAGFIYIARSGNSSLVTSVELAFRQALQAGLPVRPRIKELLVGYPCLVWLGLARRRRLSGWFLLFALGGSAAVASAINSFATVNTPVAVSFMRCVLGLAGGLIVGFVLAPVVDWVLAAWARLFDMPLTEAYDSGRGIGGSLAGERPQS